MKQLVFDTTDANTIADSDSVGAYIRSSDGTRITHTNDAGNSKDRLDVLSVLADEAGNPVSVTGGALDINVASGNLSVDLVHTSDSVRLGDGTTLHTGTTVGSDHGLDVYNLNDPGTADTAIANAANTLAVASTAEDVVASPLANRKRLFIYNEGNRTIHIGATGVTAANGFPLDPSNTIELLAGPSIDIEWVGPNTAQEIRTLELS